MQSALAKKKKKKSSSFSDNEGSANDTSESVGDSLQSPVRSDDDDDDDDDVRTKAGGIAFALQSEQQFLSVT